MFKTKTWTNRVTEFPTKRILTKEDGSSEIVTVARAEGSVSAEGDAFNAENMNDLEVRIGAAINGLFKLYNLSSGAKAFTANQTGWLEIPISIPEGYKVIAQSAYFGNPSHIHVVGIWILTSKVMIGYRCISAITSICAVSLTLAKESLIEMEQNDFERIGG